MVSSIILGLWMMGLAPASQPSTDTSVIEADIVDLAHSKIAFTDPESNKPRKELIKASTQLEKVLLLVEPRSSQKRELVEISNLNRRFEEVQNWKSADWASLASEPIRAFYAKQYKQEVKVPDDFKFIRLQVIYIGREDIAP